MQKKILLVDDDPGICSSLAFILRDEGYSVDETTDSGEAANLIQKNKYGLCLFDYKMKGFNGLDLLKMIKDINPACPVFIISGMLHIENLGNKKVNSNLADCIISKPFDIDELLQKVSAVL